MEEGVYEKVIVPDYSLAEEDSSAYYDTQSFPTDVADVGGSTGGDAKRFYNGEEKTNDAGGATTKGSSSAGTTATGVTEEGVPEFVPRAIPVRYGSESSNGFTARTSFYGQALKVESGSGSDAISTTTATSTASSSGGGSDGSASEKNAYDEYEAWFNQMDVVSGTAESGGTIYAQDDANAGAGEPVDPDEFFAEDEDDKDEDKEGALEVAADETVSDFFAEDEVRNAFIKKQPTSPDEIELCQEQLDACPVASIGNDG